MRFQKIRGQLYHTFLIENKIILKKNRIVTKDLQPIATQHILGVTSLWLIVPVYMGMVRSNLLTEDFFGLLRAVTLVCTTAVSVIYWGYFNDENSIVMHLDINLARFTAFIHFIYALTLSSEYACIGTVGTILISALYTASREASNKKLGWSVKVRYHLLFRYIGFWEVFILNSYTAISSPLEWFLIFVVTSIAYFGHTYTVFVSFSPEIGYEFRLIMISVLIMSITTFIDLVH